MAGVNKVIIVGNLGDDPEVKYTQNGVAIANISVATSESWKDQNGQKQEHTEWHRVSLFKRLAEVVGEYLKKGSKVYIEGKIKTRKWTDQNGIDRYITEIHANQLQMLNSRNDQQQQSNQNQSQHQQQNNQAQQDAYFVDDIPF